MESTPKRYRENITNDIVSKEQTFFDNSKWLTAKEASQYLRLSSVEVLRNMVCQRRVPCYKLGKSLRFKVSELDSLMEPTGQNRRF